MAQEHPRAALGTAHDECADAAELERGW